MILKEIKHESVKGAKYVFINGEKLAITNETRRSVVIKAMRSQRQEITEVKVNEWIKNF